MNTTTINGINYTVGKLDARTQFHVWRRILPLLMSLDRLPSILAILSKLESTEEKMAAMLAASQPLFHALSQMSDQDSDYVINTCLSVCKREQDGGKFAQVLAPSGVLMFEDMDMNVMVQLTLETIQGNLGNFFDLLAAALK